MSMLRFRAVGRISKKGGAAALLSSRIGFPALLALIAVYYLFLLSNGTFELFAPELLSRVFSNMLVHLLHGDFTVDRNVIDFEAFTRNGKTYSYFGVFPALLRLVAMPFTDVAQAELAQLSCLTAVVIFVALQLRMLLIVHNSLPLDDQAPDLLAVMVAATVLSGPQLYILASAWIYHEPILWAAAIGAAFNLIVVSAALGGGLSGRNLVWLAVFAGVAMLTRPSVAVALCVSTLLLVAWTGWQRWAAERREWTPSSKLERALPAMFALVRDPRISLPVAILGLMAVASGVINFERWGNPFTFADFRDYDFSLRHRPSDLVMLRNFGEFNLGRIWIGALYYATGIPYVLKGVPPFAGFLHERFMGIEAPPITPFLTNPLTVILGALGVYRLWRNPELPASGVAILRLALIGNSLAVLLIFAAMYLALRFRLDLAPFMTLAAVVGYRHILAAAAQAPQRWRIRLRTAAATLCVLGIVSSHYVLLVHKVWSIGVPTEVRRALLPFAPFARAALDR